MSVVIETQMLIRKPVAEVFHAFIEPEITSKFWFTSSTGHLIENRTVDWYWEKYEITTSVYIEQLINNELIQIIWGEPKSTVDFIFEKITEQETYLRIRNYDISLDGSALVAFAIEQTAGFTTVLDGCKAYLEYGAQLNLVNDKFPPFV
ncbi:SRPBCC domain-containing protein [Acinetobacter sp. SM34]|uniref:SRPBCC domain-containing protein n=1 Tax=Acinetobacter sp. SM34 TaxID=1301620 RepID=UPI001EDAF066|nr:SRPBCC domain-containing protein [Acinetobacter sp. SM34]MCG2607367.1 SRPBCC domain-containing protein [Acinetobacter sp. SM34]